MCAVISFTWKAQWTYIMFYLYLNRTHKCQKCKYFKTRASVNICLEAIVKRRHCLTWFLTYCHELGVNGKHQKGKNFMFNPCVSKLPVYQYPLLKLYLQMNVDISICSNSCSQINLICYSSMFILIPIIRKKHSHFFKDSLLSRCEMSFSWLFSWRVNTLSKIYNTRGRGWRSKTCFWSVIWSK